MYLLSVLLVLLSLQLTPVTSSQTAASTITQVEQRFTDALLKKDHVVVGEMLADDLVHIGFEGQVAGKTEYMAFFKQGIWQYRKYELTDMAVKILGNTAVVTGRVNRTIVINNQETTGAFAFTHVWSRTGDIWRLSSSHVTTVPNK